MRTAGRPQVQGVISGTKGHSLGILMIVMLVFKDIVYYNFF